MAIKLEAVRYSEDLSQYYLNELVPLSDQVFRFAYALTLSTAGALKITEWAYIEATSDLDKIKKAGRPLLALFHHCWERFAQLKSHPWQPDQNQISKFFSAVPTKARAVFAAVDLFGTPLDQFKLEFAWDDSCIKDLAMARKSIVNIQLL